MGKEPTCIQICADHSGLENRVTTLERESSEARKAIIEIRDRLLGRPTWMVCLMLTGMFGAIVALVVALLKAKQ